MDKVVQIIELIVMIMCYGMYFYNDIKKIIITLLNFWCLERLCKI